MSKPTARLSRRAKFWALGIAAAVLLFGAGFYANGAWLRYDIHGISVINRQSRPDMAQFWDVYNLLHEKYDGTIDPRGIVEGAIRGEVASLGDPYTTYLSKQEARDLANQLKGALSGIGIEVGIKNNRLTIIAPIDGTPAAKAGLRAGDIIAAIDGVDASSLTLDDAVAKIRGQAGTKVKLAIVRGTTTLTPEITRQAITVASVSSQIRDGQIGYIRIREFGDDTAAAIKQAAADFKAARVRGVVLDLRDNPGGYLNTAVDVVSQFQDNGVVVTEKGKNRSNDHSYYATGSAPLSHLPLVVIINAGSASASEITAGALHDSDGATLVGEKSFGKGVVQEVVDLAGGNQLKVTVAKWYTPKGTNISAAGIKPDVAVPMTDADFSAGRDPQLDQALASLNARL